MGILSAALKKDRLEESGYRTLIETTTRLNRAGPDLARIPGVHAMTDVTGFGLLGHLLEMCRGARLGARISMAAIPLLDDVANLAAAGFVTGASARNWASYGDEVRLAPQLEGLVQNSLMRSANLRRLTGRVHARRGGERRGDPCTPRVHPGRTDRRDERRSASSNGGGLSRGKTAVRPGRNSPDDASPRPSLQLPCRWLSKLASRRSSSRSSRRRASSFKLPWR